MRVTKKHTFFWGIKDGPFSQWAPCNFVIGGLTYNCAEQWMMANKARLFHDVDILHKVMATDSPREQKKLGRQVHNWDDVKWRENAKLVVYRGNVAKFKQNDDFRRQLLDTGNTVLVEASPFDSVWGIGMAENHPDADDSSKWFGTNWLGEILTLVREDFKNVNL